jgi:hypothetical protein
MTSRSFPSALAAALDPPQADVLGTLGYVPAPERHLFHNATEFSVHIGSCAPRMC